MLLLLVAALVAVTDRAFPLIVLAAVAVALAADQLRRARRRAAVRRFRRERPGKDLLLVYTDSPHWRPYIEANWLSQWEARAAVLNRSRPWAEAQPEAALWRAVAGTVEHTPLAVVVPPRGRLTVVRLYRAFRDFKYGKPEKLRSAEAALRAALDARGGGAA